MYFDMATALSASALVSAVMAGAFWVTWRFLNHDKAVFLWAAGQLCWAIGLALLLLRPSVPLVLSLYLANGLLLASMILAWHGAATFCKRPMPWRATVISGVTFLVTFIWFTEVTPDITARIVILRLLIAGMALGTALVLVRCHDATSLLSRYVAGLAFAPMILMLVSSATVAAMNWNPSRPFNDHPIITLSVIGSVISNMIWGLSVLLLIFRRQERAHTQVLEPYRALVEQSLAGTWVIRDNLFSYVNPAMAKLLGYEQDEMIGRMSPFDIIVEDERAEAAERLRLSLNDSGSMPQSHTFTGQTKDGRTLTLEVQGRRIVDAKGLAVAGLLLDVTARTRAEAAARHAHDILERQIAARTADLTKFRLAIEQSPAGVIILDAAGQLEYANSSFKALINDDLDCFLALPTFSMNLDEVRRLGKPWRGRIQRPRPDGSIQWLTMLISVVCDASGRPSQYVVTGTDTTLQAEAMQTLTQARAAAERSNRARSELLANMGHELRTPLNAIIGFAGMMEGEVLGPLGNPRYREYARDMRVSAERQAQVIDDVLDMAAAEAGTLTLHEQSICVADLIQSAASAYIDRSRTEQITLTTAQSAHDLHTIIIKGDTVRLQQALSKVLDNAIRFTPPGGTVTISTAHTPGSDLAITIADSGIGMDDAGLNRALEPFGQVNGTLSRPLDGAGLGLPLAAEIMSLHGGTLRLKSTPGAGTHVTLTLPSGRLMSVVPENRIEGRSG